jgi:hypothetical protein
VRLSEGNCWRTQATSSALVLAASGVAAELIFLDDDLLREWRTFG